MVVAGPDEPAHQLLYGREAIWARLRAHLTAARAGTGRLVWLSGEAGIGKTRLLSELDREATSEGATVLHGSGWEDPGTPPFWVWTQVLREATARRTAAELEVAWGLRVRDALGLLPELGVGGRVPAEEGTTARFPLFDAFAAVVTGLADERPVVLLLDDLHWTDPGSLRLLQFLESTVARLPVLVVGAWRDHELTADTELGGLAVQIATRSDHIAIRGLATEAVARLVTATGGIEVGAGLATRLTERTAGNPLFVIELSRLARDRGTRAVLDAMPGTAQEIIRRRLARISQSCHDLLSLAAVAGTATSLDVIARLAGREPQAIVGDVDEAVEAGLVAIGSGRVEIAHPLIRDGLIGALPARRAREIHLDVARLLTPLLVADPTKAAEIAQHLILALPLGSVADAVAMGERAARTAFQAQAYEESARHFAQALDLVDVVSPRRFELLVGYGEALLVCGDLDLARTVHLAAAELARSADDAERFARAALGVAAGLSGFEVRLWDQVQIDLLDEALTRLPEADSAVRADLLARLSVAVSFTDDEDRRHGLAESAVAMARRVGEPRTVAHALAAHCDAIAGPDDTEWRVQESGEVVELARAAGDRGLELLGLRLRVVALLEEGRRTDAAADIRTFSRVAKQVGQPLYAWYLPLWEGFEAHLSGDLDGLLRCAEEVARIGRQAESRNAETLAFVQQLWVAVERLRAAAKLAELRKRIGDLAELTPDGGVVMGLFPGQPDAVRQAAAERMDEALDRLPRDSEYISNLCHVATSLWQGQDEGRYAAPVYEALLPYAHRFAIDGIAAGTHGSVERALGALATLEGRYDEGQRHFERARTANAAFGAWLAVAHTDWMHAGLLARRDAPGDAGRRRDLLMSAREAYTAMGIHERVALVSGLLDELPAGPAPEQAAGVFHRAGDFYEVSFRGTDATLKQLKGMADLAVLLARPGSEVHVLDLAGAPIGANRGLRADVPAGSAGDVGEVLDARARDAYRRRLEELEDDLAEAEQASDGAAVDRARIEKEFLVAELAAAYGLSGRVRRAGDPAERARTTVTWRIREAIKRIEEAHPDLGRHLRASVRTGTFCSYSPEQPQSWRF